MVGEPGLEPGTSGSQNQRASQLRYSPKTAGSSLLPGHRVKRADGFGENFPSTVNELALLRGASAVPFPAPDERSSPISRGTVMIDKKLLDILACPLSKAPLLLDGERLVSTDATTRRAYRIEDGIPILLVDEGTELPAADHTEILTRHRAQPYVKPTQKKVRS